MRLRLERFRLAYQKRQKHPGDEIMHSISCFNARAFPAPLLTCTLLFQHINRYIGDS